MQHSRAGDLLGCDLLRVDAKAIRTAPEDGSLTGGVVDEDIRALVGAVLSKLDVVQVDSLAEQAFHLDTAALIVADRADVLDAHSQLRAGDHRAGHLPARAEDLFGKRNFAGVSGKFREQKESVCRVESNADYVEGCGSLFHRHQVEEDRVRTVIRFHLLYFRRFPSSNFKIVGNDARAGLQLFLQLRLQHVVCACIQIQDDDIRACRSISSRLPCVILTWLSRFRRLTLSLVIRTRLEESSMPTPLAL